MEAWAPNLSWIEPDLAVGGSFPIEQTVCLARDHGVGAVVDLREEACDDLAALNAEIAKQNVPRIVRPR